MFVGIRESKTEHVLRRFAAVGVSWTSVPLTTGNCRFLKTHTKQHSNMKNKSLVSITDYSKEEYLRIIALAEEFSKVPVQPIMQGKVVANLFFEPSTRTRLSFESAVNRLGGRIIGFSDTGSSSVTKGETLYDTIKIVSNYCDLIVIRHPPGRGGTLCQ